MIFCCGVVFSLLRGMLRVRDSPVRGLGFIMAFGGLTSLALLLGEYYRWLEVVCIKTQGFIGFA